MRAHAGRLERVERGADPVEQPLVVVPRPAHEALQPREVRVFHAGLDQRAVHEREQLDRFGVAERVEVEMLAQDLPLRRSPGRAGGGRRAGFAGGTGSRRPSLVPMLLHEGSRARGRSRARRRAAWRSCCARGSVAAARRRGACTRGRSHSRVRVPAQPRATLQRLVEHADAIEQLPADQRGRRDLRRHHAAGRSGPDGRGVELGAEELVAHARRRGRAAGSPASAASCTSSFELVQRSSESQNAT